MMPLVSALCPTYARSPHSINLLEECFYWFARQTYPNKELIVLNDAPNQIIHCDVPGIIIYNFHRRFDNLGDKRNELVRLANGDILLPWDDDDISLPNRMAQAAAKLADADYFDPRQSFYQQGGILYADHKHNCTHNASAYTRTAFRAVGGYPPLISGEDQEIVRRFHEQVRVADPLGSVLEWTYVYRWGVSRRHLSGLYPSQFRAAWDDYCAETCEVHITPKMHRDYAMETEALARARSV